MNAKELIETLRESSIKADDFYRYGLTRQPFYYSITEEELEALKNKVGEVKLIDEDAEGDEYTERYNVYYFADHNVYLKLTGIYNSYDGFIEYEDKEDFGEEVFPKEITKTVYE